MIRINLLGEKVDNSGIYLLQVLVYASCLVLAVGACFFIHGQLRIDRELMQQEETMLMARLKKLQQITKEVEDLELKEKVVKEKLSTIAYLKARKHGPVHILHDLTESIPDRAWVEEVKEHNGFLRVTGVALDNQTIAVFMAKLGESAYFDDVDLIQSVMYIKDGVNLKRFDVSLRLVNPIEAKKKSRTPAEDI